MSLLNLGNEVFANFVFYGTLALGKTALMSIVTGYFRAKHQSVPSLEDAKLLAPTDKEKQKKLLVANENVERARKAHLNDLENVVPFVVMGLLYVCINPDPATALWHFRIFFACRVLHSIAYIGALKQPARGLGFAGGYLVFWSMFAQTLIKLCN